MKRPFLASSIFLFFSLNVLFLSAMHHAKHVKFKCPPITVWVEWGSYSISTEKSEYCTVRETGFVPVDFSVDQEQELINGVIRGNIDHVRDMLERGVDVNLHCKQHYPFNSFLYAVAKGSREMIDMLIRAGANVNKRLSYTTIYRWQPFTVDLSPGRFAERCGKEEIVKYLDYYEKVSLLIAFDGYSLRGLINEIDIRSGLEVDRIGLIRSLIDEHNLYSDAVVDNEGRTFLYKALDKTPFENPDKEIARLLIEKGADIQKARAIAMRDQQGGQRVLKNLECLI